MELLAPEQIIMGLIINAGDAKQHSYQALHLAKAGKYDEADIEMKQADTALLEAHNLQTKFLTQEAQGNQMQITALFVHSQDHLMTTLTEINLIKELIEVHKELNVLKG